MGNAQPVEQTVYQNAKSIDLPATVPVKFPNGYNDDRKVTWKDADIKAIDLTKVGDYEVAGTVDDGSSSAAAKLTVHVVATRTVPPLRSLSLSRWSVGLKARRPGPPFRLIPRRPGHRPKASSTTA